ncbi:tumor necrosis factor receptor superfamily member 5-like [Mya arenaria]|uniref:tumor necrosis factor receptor superfamily member 5-like n=1 Tax=Mya arenaria TaxID=6604 RepID=UPI0022E437E7|nr:tumor necrosis factor receptor superfamily member 5-like [Mya arenaria]
MSRILRSFKGYCGRQNAFRTFSVCYCVHRHGYRCHRGNLVLFHQISELYFTKMGCKMRVACFAFLLAASTTEILAQLNVTHYTVEFNYEIIHCKLCPPGTFWVKHCTQDGGHAICQDCPDGRFIKHYNRVLYCRRCTECTENDQTTGEVAEACTQFHDTICECKPGYWREESVGDCQEVSPCESGYGVKKMANSHKDTTCERCVNKKTFSSTSSEVTPCQNCSHCLEGWVQKIPCNETQDTMCIPKDEVKADILIITLLGLVGVVLLPVVIMWRKTCPFLEKFCSLNQEKHDDEEQAYPLQQGRRRQENLDDVEQANSLQQG